MFSRDQEMDAWMIALPSNGLCESVQTFVIFHCRVLDIRIKVRPMILFYQHRDGLSAGVGTQLCKVWEWSPLDHPNNVTNPAWLIDRLTFFRTLETHVLLPSEALHGFWEYFRRNLSSSHVREWAQFTGTQNSIHWFQVGRDWKKEECNDIISESIWAVHLNCSQLDTAKCLKTEGT